MTVNYFGNAEAAAKAIVTAFETPDSLPEPMAQMFFRRRDDLPCRRWSWRNQMLVALRGTMDARGFRQWQQVGRWVKSGEKAFHILAPLVRKKTDSEDVREREMVVGFRGVPVFGIEQTEGRPLPSASAEQQWIDALPLVEVARHWGLTVSTFDARTTPFLGLYRRKKGILLGVKNLATWAHELVHAADDRLGGLTGNRTDWSNEVVAELGAAVLLRLTGHDAEIDLGGCRLYIRRHTFRDGLTIADACGQVLDRACNAVRLVLDTADSLPWFGVSS
jgi:hypothetical protein